MSECDSIMERVEKADAGTVILNARDFYELAQNLPPSRVERAGLLLRYIHVETPTGPTTIECEQMSEERMKKRVDLTKAEG